MMKTLAAVLILSATIAAAQETQVELREVARGFDDPVSITHAGDTRLFITEQTGRVRIYDGTRVLAQPFLDVRTLISTGGERGLLSIAFHPRYRENGFFYVNYTDTNGHTVVARYTVSATDPNVADPNSALVILRVNQPFSNHNGGQLQFGPDGFLYIGMGDGGSGGDPGNRAQNLNDLLGKMLRIDVDGAAPYAVPPTNPFVGQAGVRGEIWSYGLRNPWRFSFDRLTGDLWISDVGQGLWEEVNVVPGSSRGGENYGWRRMEGSHCFNPQTNCQTTPMVLPVIEYGHTNGACSVTGGYVYRGTRYPRLRGMYVYGDYCNGVMWGATPNGNGTYTSRVLTDTSLFISTFGEDLYGELYVAGHTNGVIYRITDAVEARGIRRRSVRP